MFKTNKLLKLYIFSSIETKYIAFTLAVKKVVCLGLLQTKLKQLEPNKPQTQMNIINKNMYVLTINNKLKYLELGRKGILLKNNNLRSIIWVHNFVGHARTEYINILHQYI